MLFVGSAIKISEAYCISQIVSVTAAIAAWRSSIGPHTDFLANF